MAREPAAVVPTRVERDEGSASLDQIVLVLLGALAAVLVVAGAGRRDATVTLAVGSAAGAVALVLVARRSMELFTLLVLVLRPAVDGFHAADDRAMTDPPTVLAAVFVAVAVVWLVGRWLRGERHPRSWVGLALAAFLAAGAVATLGSEEPARSVVELSRLAAAALMFFVVDRVCERTGRPDRFVAAILAAAVVPVTVALVGPFVGFDRFEVKDRIERAISTFTQSNPLGHFLVIVLLVLMAFVLLRTDRTRRRAGLAMVPVVLVLGLTYTRLAWGAAVVGLLVMLWVAGRRWLVPVVVMVLLVVAALSPDVGRRIEQLTSSNTAVIGSESGLGWRLGQWADVAALADRNPVTGIGPDVVVARLANAQPPHNDYLRAFVEMGLVGFLAYLAVLVAMVEVAVGSWRRADGARAATIALAFAGVVSAFLVASGAANLLGQVVLLWYVLALAAAAAWVGRHGVVRTSPDHPAVALTLAPPAGVEPDHTLPAPVAVRAVGS